MIEHAPEELLVLGVAIDDDVALPKAAPCLNVAGEQACEGRGPDNHPDGLVFGVFVVR